MTRVVVESPWGRSTREEIEENKAYARMCVRDSLRRGEAPYASHLFFDHPEIINDMIFDEETLGIKAGFAWAEAAEDVAFYVDRGISAGMIQAFDRAMKTYSAIVVRSLENDEEIWVPLVAEFDGAPEFETARKVNLDSLHRCAISITGSASVQLAATTI